MKNIYHLLFPFISILFFFSDELEAQNKYDYNDGPYIELKEDSIYLQWIEMGIKKDSTILSSKADSFLRPNLPEINLQNLDFEVDTFKRHNGVSKIAALSDIHGQHDLFLEILLKQRIIDENLKWNYGNGHLVIVGDIFDRGDKVTEALWFLFDLEKQAKQAGGKVHVLLGNHELMVLHNDVRYIHPKYLYTSGINQKPYPSFFSDKTVLGQWLRSKNITSVINDIGFVHGGYSPQVLAKEKSINKINDLFKQNILPQAPNPSDSLLNLLYFNNGPLWYRGYANPSGFDIQTADKILNTLSIQNIVVGHTSMPRIVSIHDNKIILVDSSIKFGTTGEILIFEEDEFYRGLLSGEMIKMSKSKRGEETFSPFEYVLGLGDKDLMIELNTDVSYLLGKNKAKEEYQDAELVAFHNGEFNRTWDVRLRSSGNARKKVCRLPPIKIDFSKSTLDYLGFTKNDKLKLILPCSSGKHFQNKLYQEFVIYKMFRHVNELGLKNHLVQVKLMEGDKVKHDVVGFFLEDDDDFVNRTGSKIIDRGILRKQSLNRESYLKMIFFQYMILNTDFGISNRHNLKMIAMPNEIIPRVIPYDFDYAGIVNQEYAIPHPSLNLHSVRIPLFRGSGITKKEVAKMRDFFNEKRESIEREIKISKISKSSKKGMLNDIKRFYKDLNKEKKWRKIFLQ